MFSVLETQPQKKHFVRSGNSGLQQNGYRKTASKSISANGVHFRVKGNRRPCHGKPPKALPQPHSGRRRDCSDRAQKLEKGGRVLVINWKDEAKEIPLDWKKLAPSISEVRNFWNGKAEKCVPRIRLEPHSCRLWEF